MEPYAAIRVPREIHEKLKIVAAMKRKSIIETMTEFVDSELDLLRYLEEEEKRIDKSIEKTCTIK